MSRMVAFYSKFYEIKGFARVCPKELFVTYNEFSNTLYLTEKSENQ